jgi:D-alanine-D-alanine ligase
MKKLKVAVIFGGKSGEHEVSLVSASSVINALDREKYEVQEFGIRLNGEWMTGENCLEKFKKQDYEGLQTVAFSTEPLDLNIDIAFPVLHGPFGEDGTIQGLFEMLSIPYVGCGVLASSTAMDKLQCKAILEAAGVPVVPYVGFNRGAWQKEQDVILKDINENIGLPCFVKPANMGSSVGITKAKDPEELIEAINLAAKFDRRLLVEKAVNAREIECAVLGNDDPVAAPLGEVIVGGEFYDFNDKYIDGKSSTVIPAPDLSEEKAAEIKKMCVKTYKLLDCAGLARVDAFIDRDSDEIYLNELNTMPGFTSISMYPQMMEAYELPYPKLIDRLIDLGLERFADKQKNQVVFSSESDWYQ